MEIDSNTVFVLGARDPEMDFIRRTLQVNGLSFKHACANGDRVNPRSAYPSSNCDGPTEPMVAENQVWIECAPPGGKALLNEMGIPFIDHHYPGDPGYDTLPADHWEGSSIGQLYRMLGLEPAEEVLLVSAIDHCINAAYRNECEGIDPDAVFEYQLLGISDRTGKPTEMIAEKIASYQRVMAISQPKQYKTRSGVLYVHEFFETVITTFWEFLCIREAALSDRATIAVLTQFTENGCSPERKLMIIGHPTEDFIKRFKASEEIYPAVKGRFGVPVRGYCGGYPEPEVRKAKLYTGRGEDHDCMVTRLMGDDFVTACPKGWGDVEVKLPLANINNTLRPFTLVYW